MARWFHGTSEAAAAQILAGGFKPGCYFATTREVAATYGPAVLEVEAGYVPAPRQWHWRAGEVIAAENIVSLRFSQE